MNRYKKEILIVSTILLLLIGCGEGTVLSEEDKKERAVFTTVDEELTDGDISGFETIDESSREDKILKIKTVEQELSSDRVPKTKTVDLELSSEKLPLDILR